MIDKELVEGLRPLLPECTRDESDALLAAVKARFQIEDTEAFLISTDDAAPPWPVFRGGWLELVRAVLEQRYFEYTLVAEDLSWIVFDTHHNQLVIAGLGNNPRQ